MRASAVYDGAWEDT